MSDKLVLVGDELRYDGEVVALLCDTSPAVRAFEDSLKFPEGELDGRLFDEALKSARGGLVRVTDLTATWDKLKGEA